MNKSVALPVLHHSGHKRQRTTVDVYSGTETPEAEAPKGDKKGTKTARGVWSKTNRTWAERTHEANRVLKGSPGRTKGMYVSILQRMTSRM